jgi:sulfate adenylyltransferase subunit 2
MKLNVLNELEEESISIIRDTYSKSSKPVVLYSIGKDSSVLLHLFRKAFFPLDIPITFLHVDTTWKFKEMITFRDTVFKKFNLKYIVYTNKDGVEAGINPFDHEEYTDIMKTNALKNALKNNQFDYIYGGARRDEEASRSKEKIVSHRDKNNKWFPKNQNIEPWLIFNPLKKMEESFRVFPISNWTELNIWEYIEQESIPVVPLYFAKKRKVVSRNDSLFLLDDERFRLNDEDTILETNVRFRTLGCYPLTSGIKSNAENVSEIIKELKETAFSERSGRLIDYDKHGSMELKKRDGYF